MKTFLKRPSVLLACLVLVILAAIGITISFGNFGLVKAAPVAGGAVTEPKLPVKIVVPKVLPNEPTKTPGYPSTYTEGCDSSPQGFTDVSRFQVPSMGVNSALEALGTDANGSPLASQTNPLYGAAWYVGSPRPGSEQGKVIVNIHNSPIVATLGGALVRDLKPGDLIKITTKSGKVVCYRYTHKIHFFVKDYNPNSNIYYDNSGSPQLAIMTCADIDPRTIHSAGRYILYGDLVKQEGKRYQHTLRMHPASDF